MPDITKDIGNVKFYRNVKRYLSGFDVLRVKKRLVELGYLRAATTRKFGGESYAAVKAFQRANDLDADGIVGKYTWAALFHTAANAGPAAAVKIPAHLPDGLRTSLGAELAQASAERRALCLLALAYAIDPYHPGDYPRSLYIRGGNLFNKDLTENVITMARIESGAAKQPEYYDGGRREFMLEAVDDNPAITGADCSGGVVGLWRRENVRPAGFDANANTLYAGHCVRTSSPKPGDLAWKSGHIGLYVGAGRIVEWAGGAYGCQLTKANDRRCYNYVEKRLSKMPKWQAYGDPKHY